MQVQNNKKLDFSISRKDFYSTTVKLGDAVIENHAITVLPKAKQKAKKTYITRQQMYKQ